jgi:hypothetical protein
MFPQRIVCLSAESADICAKPGAGDRIVGVSVFASRELRQARAVVSGFSTLKRGELMELSLDFSDHLLRCTAGISAELIRNHCTILATNQRSLWGIGGDTFDRTGNRLPEGSRSTPQRFHTRVGSAALLRYPASARLFRGMGRPSDFGHRLGERSN